VAVCGGLLSIVIKPGGLLGSNGVNLPGLGKHTEYMTLAVACVTINWLYE
jgi:hypothetical protein